MPPILVLCEETSSVFAFASSKVIVSPLSSSSSATWPFTLSSLLMVAVTFALSSLVIVPVAVAVAVTLWVVPETAKPTVNVSSSSISSSSLVEIVNVCVSPAVPVKVRAAVFSV